MKNLFSSLALAACLGSLLISTQPVLAQGTAFTYQGQLSSNGVPLNGNYDFEFSLYPNAAGTGSPLGTGTETQTAIGVTNGLFIVTLDYGAGVFTGSNYWLSIGVRTNGGASFTALSPLQEVTPTPYAIYAPNAGSAASLSGGLPSASLAGVYGSAVTLDNPANQFTGDGTGVTNVNAAALNGLAATNFWQTTGNSGTTPGVNFLGTTDDTPIELWANAQRVLHLESVSEAGFGGSSVASVNVIAGMDINFVSSGVIGATISGGGKFQSGNFALGYPNWVSGDFGTVAGGYENSSGAGAAVSGGNNNSADNGSVVAGGSYNSADTNSAVGGGSGNAAGNYGTVPGGTGNTATGANSFAAGNSAQATNDGTFVWADNEGPTFSSTTSNQFSVRAGGGVVFVTGGAGMTLDGQPVLALGDGILIQQNSDGAPNIILGSPVNYASPGVVGATIGGGGETKFFGTTLSNCVTADFGTAGGGAGNSAGYFATVGGGFSNNASGYGATVGGGTYNIASGQAATVGGGAQNTADGFAAAVGGGTNNIASGPSSFVGSGYSNTASGQGSFVGGGGYDGIHVSGNTASGLSSTVAGGFGNQAANSYATVGGGVRNIAGGQDAAVGGGEVNNASESDATVSGGAYNTASGEDATVGGGFTNTASGLDATEGGGAYNIASGELATVGGGWFNNATNKYATVPGGAYNIAGGQYSFAAGQQAQATNDGSFVWADSQNAAFTSTASNQFLIRAQGGVGINTSNPQQQLEVNGEYMEVDGLGGSQAYMGDDGAAGDVQIGSLNPDVTHVSFWNASGSAWMNITCATITIEGGSDLAEPFQITAPDKEIPPGSVVVIDDKNPGRLKMSTAPYDTRVAGVVSGANGVNPGIKMHQQELLGGGKNVALTGRVYVLADASKGAITPGDLLTTSATPGHAMKVIDHAKAQGAILGKAMSGLKAGKGMVLVLVTLQ